MSQGFFKRQLDLASYFAHTSASSVTQPKRSIERRAVLSHINDSITFSVRDEKKILSAIFLSVSSLDQISADAPSKEHSVNTSISKTAEVGISSACVIIAVALSCSNGTTTLCIKLATIGGANFGTRGPVVRYSS